MEIHELNTFSGTPGEGDFLAIDNGMDTSKISIADIIGPLNARIDNIIAGPAPSAEEVIDARQGANGITYSSLGAAIRAQVNGINRNISTLADLGVASYHFRGTTRTLNGITCTWNDDDTCSVSGTATADMANAIWAAATSLPNWLIAGKDYDFIYETTDPNVKLGFIFGNGNTYKYEYISASAKVHIPADCVTIGVRLYVNRGVSITGTATASAYVIYDPELSQDVRKANHAIESNGDINLLASIGEDNLYSFNSVVNISGVRKADYSYDVTANMSAETTGILDVYRDKTKMPYGIIAGETYNIRVKADKVAVQINSYTSASDSGTVIFRHEQNNPQTYYATFTVPSNATGLAIRLQYITTLSETITDNVDIYIARRTKVPFYNNSFKCLGNSFTTGAVWHNDAFDHFVEIEDSIYGLVAKSLNVDKFKTRNLLYSSTGMLYNGGAGCFHDMIVSGAVSIDDLSYLMTLMNSGDMSKPLGNADSTANDGTLAGAVIDVMEHIKTTNDKCRLILLGVPPYSSDAPHTGATVFTGNWSQGYSINDLDNVMYALAKKYHFTYVSWQDLSMSYHYMDFADYAPGYTGARHANDDTVYRALGEYVAMQIHAVNSPIALGKIVQ